MVALSVDWIVNGQVTEEATERSQAAVPARRGVVAITFQMLEKGDDAVDIEMGYVERSDGPTLPSGDEQEVEPYRMGIGA